MIWTFFYFLFSLAQVDRIWSRAKFASKWVGGIFKHNDMNDHRGGRKVTVTATGRYFFFFSFLFSLLSSIGVRSLRVQLVELSKGKGRHSHHMGGRGYTHCTTPISSAEYQFLSFNSRYTLTRDFVHRVPIMPSSLSAEACVYWAWRLQRDNYDSRMITESWRASCSQ